MSRPLLQLALDHSSLEAAQRDVTQLKDSVDIVEAGTILCLNEGLGAVKALREQCPDKIIVADWKVADAGETLAQQAFGAGANWMTIICAAPLATVEKGHAMAQRCGGEIQIELFGNCPRSTPARRSIVPSPPMEMMASASEKSSRVYSPYSAFTCTSRASRYCRMLSA